MTQKNAEEPKLGRQGILIALGVFLTSIVTVISISDDKTIQVHAKILRQASDTSNRDSFSQSLIQAIHDNISPVLCENSDAFFSQFMIAGSKIQMVSQNSNWNSNIPPLEQEALRRCEEPDKNIRSRACFIIQPSKSSHDGFLAAKSVLVELYLNLRNPANKRLVGCREAMALPQFQMNLYYSLYWQEGNQYHRMTGGGRALAKNLKSEAQL